MLGTCLAMSVTLVLCLMIVFRILVFVFCLVVFFWGGGGGEGVFFVLFLGFFICLFGVLFCFFVFVGFFFFTFSIFFSMPRWLVSSFFTKAFVRDHERHLYVIAGKAHWLKTFLFRLMGRCLSGKISLYFPKALHSALIWSAKSRQARVSNP